MKKYVLWISVVIFAGGLALGYWLNVHLAQPKALAEHPIKRTKLKRAFSPLEKYRQGVLREALAIRNSAFEDCYEKFLRTEPTSEEGHITAQWTIGSNGVPLESSIREASLGDESLHTCVLAVIPTLALRPPPGQEPIRVAHKFKFKRKTPTEIVFH